jgi:beta-galactosidase
LNEAWGNAFWSMDVQDFEQVSLPNLTVTEANPAAKLAFWRFQSSQVAAYNAMQCEIIRAHSPGRFITHNFMGFFNEFDHWPVGEQIDLASWDSYPIGFVERFPFSDDERARWALASHPDIAPFHHDLYRGVGHGRFWVMEQQPGPVNWAPWNPVPKPGMVRLWTWEALAHGAEVVSYFRWRQAPFAQEQMHAGLNLPGLHELSQGGREAAQVGRELKELGSLPKCERAPVALVYDYPSSWMTRIQPQGADFRYHEFAFRLYESARRRGFDIDFVPPGAPLDGYKLVLVPPLLHVNEAAAASFAAAAGIVLYGPRTGSKTRDHSIPEGLPPGPLRELLGLRVLEVSSLRPSLSVPVSGAAQGAAIRWREHIETSAETLARFSDGRAALTSRGNHYYLACWPDADLLDRVMTVLCKRAGLATATLPPQVRVRRRGGFKFAFNYGDAPWHATLAGMPVLGSEEVGAQSLAIWRD